jgi:hypothetical protein
MPPPLPRTDAARRASARDPISEASGYRWVPVADVASLPVPDELPDLIAAVAKYAVSITP